MSKLLRHFSPEQIVFATSVVDKRRKILIDNFAILWEGFERIRKETGFGLIAWVVLPDHFHTIIKPGKSTHDSLMKRIKLVFSYNFRLNKAVYRGKVWQARYWDHIIRDQEDLNRHIDYIHYNPVKHGYVSRPKDWEYSSFEQYLAEGYYSEDWGIKEKPVFHDDFGE